MTKVYKKNAAQIKGAMYRNTRHRLSFAREIGDAIAFSPEQSREQTIQCARDSEAECDRKHEALHAEYRAILARDFKAEAAAMIKLEGRAAADKYRKLLWVSYYSARKSKDYFHIMDGVEVIKREAIAYQKALK